jgi:hypothetical protein
MFWDRFKDWASAEAAWDEKAKELEKSHPLKTLKTLPQMPGIAEKGIRRKALPYLIRHDVQRVFIRYFFRRPFTYAYRYLRSRLQKRAYEREGDFFFYDQTREEFEKAIQDPKTLFVLGFSYCHKPFECPSGRFTDQCQKEAENLVCRQCFIGKCVNALPKKSAEIVWIPTIHYIGEKIFELVHAHPNRKLVFLITACEMTLEMFADFGRMAGVQGIGVRLDGRICNTMKAFELSERGIKPGLTVVLPSTQEQMLDWLALRRACFSS